MKKRRAPNLTHTVPFHTRYESMIVRYDPDQLMRLIQFF